MNKYQSRLIFPSLKRYLFDLSKDLTFIKNKCRSSTYFYDPNLTLLEIYILIIEDRRFFSHRGIDIKAIIREILRGVIFRKPYGASTIQMQFVRVCTNNYQRTFRRKFREIVLSYLLHFHIDRITILRSYINIAFFGSGMIGANSASHKLFQKSPYNLNHQEASFLASCLVNPVPLNRNVLWQNKVEERAERARKNFLNIKNSL